MSAGRTPQIVVIEDNPADIELLRFALAEVGMICDLHIIRDGGQAMEWIGSAGSVDLVVVDLNLPKHDGIEVLEAMQASELLADLPVLVLSSSPSPRDMARVKMFRNTKYVTKPTFLEQYQDVGRLLEEMLLQRAVNVNTNV